VVSDAPSGDDQPRSPLPAPAPFEDPTVVASAGNIGRRAARGGVAYAGRTITIQLLQIVSSLLIARRLAPSAYGAIAVGTTVVALARWLGDFGAANVVIQTPGIDVRDRSILGSAFFLQLASAVLATLAFVAIAPALTDLFHGPSATILVIDITAMTLIIDAFAAVPKIRLTRAMRYERIGAIRLISVGVQYAVQIGLLVGGAGLWSIVAAGVVQSFVETGLMLAYGGGTVRPRPRGLGQLARPGIAYQVSGMLIAVTDIAAVAIFGRMKGATSLGLLTWSTVLATPLIKLSQELALVGFPAFSRLDEHHRDSRRRAGDLLVRMLMLGLAAGAGILVGFAEPLVRLVFDPKWLDALPAVRLALVGAVPTALALMLGMVVESSGQPRQRMWVKVIAASVGLAALVPLGARWGVAGGAVAIYLLLPTVEAALITRRASTPLRRGLVNGLLVGGFAWIVSVLLADHAGSIPALVGLGAVAGVAAALSTLVVDRRAVLETVRLIVPPRSSKPR
jgi:O-antigen/teichoic acid export membrane protein